MDHDSTKDGAADGDRRNWRERLGVGQDLPKISDEFEPVRTHQERSDPKPSEGARSAAKPGTPVARPAPMAPRYARPAAPKPANGSSPDEGANDANHPESTRSGAAAAGLKPWAAPSRPAGGPDHHSGHERVPSSTPSSASPSSASNTPSATSRAPAYPQAGRPSGTAPASSGESFGERLRAQREAAEKLAQQRVAAAREKSLRASADALTILAPRQSPARPSGGPAAKPALGDQPRFTFAQEEIVAARQETAFAPGTSSDAAPKDAAPEDAAFKSEAHDAPDAGSGKAASPAPDRRPPDAAKLYAEPQRHAAGAPDYRHEDDAMFADGAMFEDAQPTLHAPPRASAADYSAAYREFEDEFEEEPRRRSGPLLLLASLAALAVVSGGAIYLYQQAGSTGQSQSAPPVAEATNVPVIAAPEEPAKTEPPAPQETQQAAVPTTRKEIYDRIIGEETLEPERIVPTEESPLRQIQQPGASEAGRESQSGEPLPLPLPPPPGTGIGEQGDLLVPGTANIQTASAEPASDPQPEPEPELAFPEPGDAADPGRHPADGGTFMAAAPTPGSEPETRNSAPAEAAMSAASKLRGTAPATEAPAPGASRPSIYPEVTEPLAYPAVRSAKSAPRDEVVEPEPRNAAPDALQAEKDAEQETAPVAERGAAPAAEAEAETIAATESDANQVAEAEPEGEASSDVPLPKAKPEPPVRAAAATPPAPRPQAPQPQRQAAAPAGSGPVQIIPTDQSQAPVARAVQPRAQSAAPRRRTVGREPDPLAGPGSTFASSLSDSLNAAPSRQVASLDPAESSQPRAAPSQSTPSQATQADPAGGYLVQLASFRSEAEARSAYQQLARRHPQLVGNLDSRVVEASLGQVGSFWRLGVGPLSNRTEATKLCNDLIAAGEKDCLVRRN